MWRFLCPYLRGEVELTAERSRHIQERHPEVGPEPWERIAAVLEEPGEVRRDAAYPGTRLFTRWFPELLGGKHLVVAVVFLNKPVGRRWIVTAYLSRRPPKGDLEWTRSSSGTTK